MTEQEMYQKLIERVIKAEESTKINKADIAELKANYRLLHEMNTNIQLIAQQNSTTKDDIEEMKENMNTTNQEISLVKEELRATRDTPNQERANKWEKAKWIIVSVVISAIATWIINSAVISNMIANGAK